MDGDLLKEKVLELLKKIPPSAYLPLGILGVGLILLSIGLIQFFQPPKLSEEAVPPVPLPSPKAVSMTIDVEGAVINPGVYSFSTGARLKDALIAAGGLSPNADREAIAKGLNLATKLLDGGKVYIPKIGDNSTVSGNNTSGTGVLGNTTGLLNINTATVDQLDALPGVGLVTAQKIVDGRPFQTIDDLVTKKIVGKSVFEKIKDKITAN